MHFVVRWQSKYGNRSDVSDDFARLKGEFFRTHIGGEEEAIEWAYRTAKAEVAALANETDESANAFDALYDKCVDEEHAITVEARQAGITFEPVLKKFAAENKTLSANARK